MERALVVWLSVVCLVGCVSPSSAQQASARRVGDDVCLAAASTSGAAPAGAADGCLGLSADSPGWDAAFALHACGPCSFSYDAAATQRERAAGHAHDCCYRAESPPPPPLPAGGPRS